MNKRKENENSLNSTGFGLTWTTLQSFLRKTIDNHKCLVTDQPCDFCFARMSPSEFCFTFRYVFLNLLLQCFNNHAKHWSSIYWQRLYISIIYNSGKSVGWYIRLYVMGGYNLNSCLMVFLNLSHFTKVTNENKVVSHQNLNGSNTRSIPIK